jgi:hypothetical protein
MKIIASMVVLALLGCARGGFIERYKMGVKSGFRKIPEAKQIEDLLGEADHFISYSGPNVPQEWNTEVHFGGRYELTMQVVVETSFDFSRVTKVKGEPKFYFSEVSRVEHYPNGQWGADFDGSSERQFGRVEWQKIVANKGDFSAIGVKLKRGPPVPDFQRYVDAVRRDRLSTHVSARESGNDSGSGKEKRDRKDGAKPEHR